MKLRKVKTYKFKVVLAPKGSRTFDFYVHDYSKSRATRIAQLLIGGLATEPPRVKR